MAVIEQIANPVSQFLYALKAPETKRQWPKRLKIVFNFLGLHGDLDEQAKQFMNLCKEEGMTTTQNRLIEFITYQVQRSQKGEISLATIPNYLKAIKLFCEMNDIQVSWKKISRGVPRGRQAANDRAPTREEILRLVQYPDRRIKPIVYVMASSGIRLGAWDFLQWMHINPICDEKENILAAKLIVYAGEPDEYYTFITSEAYHALKEWIDFRSSYGEQVTGTSWLMRDIWQTTNINYGAKLGLATAPKKLKSGGLKRLLERALWEQGIRQSLAYGKRRHEWKAAHGFRKFYKTHAEQVMKPINVELTLGHNIGLSASYYKPKESEVLEDYLKAVESLTISNDRTKLTKQVAELKQKNKDDEYVIRGRLQEKDEQISALTQQFSTMQSQIQSLIANLSMSKDQNQLNQTAQILYESGILTPSNIKNAVS
jgi:integrase